MPEANAASRRPSGELEASVLAALWAGEGPLTPAEVQAHLGGSLARTTVTTILARLHDKGAVSRTRSGRGYAYSPVHDSPGLVARRMRTELDKGDDRGTVLARFVSQLSVADERLLRSLLDEAVGSDASAAGADACAAVTDLSDVAPDGSDGPGVNAAPGTGPDGRTGGGDR